ncbi:MAG: hypothetical protein CVV64_01945 [Candidatus Wallbacteria bacterium HGW-Wallbacteria-1]|jgi:hypothetical protein|uniref:Peptidase C-terminal archaeal/bacterial domain-containing protein n=1 Tax=Candidatus Wallbacteria bacterium HGW-Wallbacteria-1 TaxID=2013854 RepID=A0A2N1PV50_9BACT|nr:MAG: hypothetical protein CVV64_01945 [Candidatus Wallbacteria bacterium HGW-Wallbacteria-1]
MFLIDIADNGTSNSPEGQSRDRLFPPVHVAIVILTVLLFSVFPFQPALAQNPPFYESEPNDTPADANAIMPVQRVQGFLQDGNPDWFSFDIPEKNLTGETSHAGSDVFGINLDAPRETDPILILLRDGDPVVTSDTPGEGVAERVRWLRLIAGKYLLQVSGRGTNIKEPYILEIFRDSDSPQFLEQEPNNQIRWANPLSDGIQVWSHLGPGDIDFFKIQGISSEYMCEISIAGSTYEAMSPENGRMGITLVNGSGDTIKDLGSHFLSHGMTFTFRGSSDQTYLRITGFNEPPLGYGVAMSRRTRKITLEAEVNDNPNTANEISEGTFLEGAIYPSDDIDWFEFTAAGQGNRNYGVCADAVECDLSVRVVDVARGAEKTVFIAAGTSSEIFFQSSQNSQAGSFLVMLSSGMAPEGSAAGQSMSREAKADSQGRYRISIADHGEAPADSEGEINDQISSSRMVAGNGTVQGVLQPSDIDYFRLSTPGENVFDLRIILEIHPGTNADTGPCRLTFLTSRGQIIGSRTFQRDSRFVSGASCEVSVHEMKFFNLMDEAYLLRVEGVTNTSDFSYRLTAKTWEIQDPGKDELFVNEYPFHSGAGGFSALVLSSAQNRTGRYRIYYYHYPSSRLRFIEEGTLPREGHLWRLNRFRMEGFYLIRSEVPLEALAIARDPENSILIAGGLADNGTPSFGVFLQVLNSLGVRPSRIEVKSEIQTALDGTEFSSIPILAPRGVGKLIVEVNIAPADGNLEQMEIANYGKSRISVLNPSGATLELQIMPLKEHWSDSGSFRGLVNRDQGKNFEKMFFAAGETRYLEIPQGKWRIRCDGKTGFSVKSIEIEENSMINILGTGGKKVKVRAVQGEFMTVMPFSAGHSVEEGTEG